MMVAIQLKWTLRRKPFGRFFSVQDTISEFELMARLGSAEFAGSGWLCARNCSPHLLEMNFPISSRILERLYRMWEDHWEHLLL